MQLNRVVNNMLKQSTGRSLCDSGDAYGRHYQRNQSRKFTDEEACTVRFSAMSYGDDKPRLEVDTTLNIYHWLDNNFRLDKATDARLQRWIKNHEDESWLESLESFAEHDHEMCFGGEGVRIQNTDNFNNCDLSQGIQFATYTNKQGDDIWLISVHGGCDIRGGYGQPRAFTCKNEYPDFYVQSLYAGDQTWDFDGWNGWNPIDDDQEIKDLWALPAISQCCEDVNEPELTLIKEPCVLVCWERYESEGKGYLVRWSKDFDLGGQLGLDGEPAYKINLVAEEITAGCWY